MAEEDLVRLGPFGGLNTFQDELDDVFAPGGENLPFLRELVNFDMKNSGWPARRSGITGVLTTANAMTLFSGNDLLLLKNGTILYRVDPTDWSVNAIVTGLSGNPLVLYAHNDNIFWSDGSAVGRILANGTAVNWGCAVPPPPTLGVTAGGLRAGRYMVTSLFVDAQGVEHGAGLASVIEVDGTQAITFTLSDVDPNATHVRIFATRPNDKVFTFVGQVAVGDLPAVITGVNVSREQLRSQHLSPPFPADGMFSYRGQIILFADEFLYPSYGVQSHLYEMTEIIEQFPSKVVAGGGIDDGFYTACERGLFWTTGQTPENWQTWRKDNRKYVAGSLVLEGSLLPTLRTPLPVALFVSNHGLIAGLSNGTIVPLMQEKLHLDVAGKRASIIYREQGSLRQVLFTLG